MEYFDKYVSDTIAATGNQNWFLSDGKVKRGRIFYKLVGGGSFEYSLLFSSITDSTFSDGSHSVADTSFLEWKIKRVAVAVVNDCEPNVSDDAFVELKFDGKTEKVVNVSGFFATDGVVLDVKKDSYLCVDIQFCGKEIPYLEECYLIPVYTQSESGEWIADRKTPLPCMIGVNKNKKRITFWGDSITQGLGTSFNSYSHYAAVVANLIGDGYAYWDIGLGFGRARDAGLLKSWYERARRSDVAVICFGVNDILRIPDAEQIKADLKNITAALKKDGVKVVLQTVPPFDYNEEKRVVWEKVNDYVKTELVKIADEVFDCVPILGKEDSPHMAKYGGHPNDEGCKVWGEQLYKVVDKVTKSVIRVR